MAGVVDQRDAGRRGPAQEIENRPAHADIVEVGRADHREADVAQRRRHGAGVVGRIGQGGSLFVGAVADHQGDAVAGTAGRYGRRSPLLSPVRPAGSRSGAVAQS